jgi:hypothetical protein
MQTKVAISLSLLLVVLVLGCGPKATPPANNKPAPAMSSDAHTHGSGPHGGTIADWGGGKYHIEFTVDHDKKEAAIYILGGDAKTPAPVKAEKLLVSINDPQFQVELLPIPLDGEAEGSSSRFVGTDDHLGVVQEFAGTISGEVDGKPYAGDFQEKP